MGGRPLADDRRAGERPVEGALLAGYEDPGIDEAVDEELREFVERRKLEPSEED